MSESAATRMTAPTAPMPEARHRNRGAADQEEVAEDESRDTPRLDPDPPPDAPR